MQNKPLSFIENKGQLKDENSNPLLNIPYYSHDNGVNIYCMANKIAFVFVKTEDSLASTFPKGKLSPAGGGMGWKKEKMNRISLARLEMTLTNSNPSATITASGLQSYYENYYNAIDAQSGDKTKRTAKGITNVRTYTTISYQNIYPHIDLILKAGTKSLEYSFLVHPGGNVADIQIEWKGANSIKDLENGGISYAFPFGKMTESAPITYQGDATNGTKPQIPLNSKFKIDNSKLSFVIPSYDKTHDLLIDPSLEWGTYLGGEVNKNTEGKSITHDDSNDIYITGTTTSWVGIGTSGTYQSALDKVTGAPSAFIVKFNPAGQRVWGTYYGGLSSLGITCDVASNIYITGQIGSYYYTYYAFLSKFNSSGNISWHIYLGDSNARTLGNGVACDASNNIYVTGNTTSTGGIATSGAHQTSFSGGSNFGDAFITKFDSSGSQLWGTYYGGKSDEAGNAIAIDADYNVYITGNTNSDSGIATAKTYQSNIRGLSYSFNGFVAKFDSAGTLKWGTYYGGYGEDYGYGIATYGKNDIYITGETSCKTGMATYDAQQLKLTGTYHAFLAKFDSTGNLTWGTYYGGYGFAGGSGIATDAANEVYITGYTDSAGPFTTPYAYQTKFAGGGGDAFLAKFTSSGKLSYGTYIGGKGLDQGYAVTTDTNNNVYITGVTSSSTGIASSGAFDTSNTSGAYGTDAFISKFDLSTNNDAGISSIVSPVISICRGVQSVQVQLENFGINTLTSDSIYWNVNRVPQKALKWTGSLKTDSTATITLGNYNFLPGNDTIIARSAKPNGAFDSIPANDAFEEIIPVIIANTGKNTTICNGDSVTLGAPLVYGNTYSWSANPSGFSSTFSDVKVSPTTTTTYYLTESITSTGCSNTDSVIVFFHGPTSSTDSISTCYSSSIKLGRPATANWTYYWTDATINKFLSLAPNPTVKVSLHNQTIYQAVIKDTLYGCTAIYTEKIYPLPTPTSDAGKSTGVCTGDSVKIGSSAITGNTYSWASSPTGFTSGSSSAYVRPSATTTYYLTEKDTTDGCSSSDSIIVTVNSLPKPTISGDTSVCVGLPAYYVVTKNAGSSYNWSLTNGSVIYGQNTDSVNIKWKNIATVLVKVKETNNSGCSDSAKIKVIVHPNPTAIAKGPVSACLGETDSYISNQKESKYNWGVKGGSIIAGLNSDSIVVKWDSTGSMGFVSFGSTNQYGCSSTNARTPVEVYPLPDAKWTEYNVANKFTFIANTINFTDSDYQWDFGDSSPIANGNSVSHNYINNGFYSVNLTIKDTSKCTNNFDSTILVGVSGIENSQYTNLHLSIYPNPFSSIANISYTLPTASRVQVSVTDMNSQLIANLTSEQQNPGSHTLPFDATKYNCAKGIYFVKLVIDNSVTVRQIIRIE